MTENASQRKLSFQKMMAAAERLRPDTPPEDLSDFVGLAMNLDVISRDKLFKAIKKTTGVGIGALRQFARASENAENTVDHLNLARQLAAKLGYENAIACDSGMWMWADCGVWRYCPDREVKRIVQEFLPGQLSEVRKSDIDSVTDVLKTEVFTSHHEFDVGPDEAVNLLNGELILSEGRWELTPHKREHYRTSQIPVHFDADAVAPRFERFLIEIFENDFDRHEKITLVLELMGYTLMAHCNYERFVMLVGGGANGKTVLLAVLERLVGKKNTAGVQPHQFDNKFQRAHLQGKLANIVTEMKVGQLMADGALKAIVSGEPSTVEHKHGDPFLMRPFATCWFGTNHMPYTRDFSDGLFRRGLILTFNEVFNRERGNCDPQLKEKLFSEMPGILNLALAAYAKVKERGFTVPRSSDEAMKRWRVEADQVAQFLETACVTHAEAASEPVTPGWLYNRYTKWAQNSGIHRPVSIQSFVARLEGFGYKSRRSNGRRVIDGIRLTADGSAGTAAAC